MMHDAYAGRIATAKEMAQSIVILCERYERAASPATINKLLASVERLAAVMEAIEVERTLKALDGQGAASLPCLARDDND